MWLSGRRAHAMPPLTVKDAPTRTYSPEVRSTAPIPSRATIVATIDTVPAAASATAKAGPAVRSRLTDASGASLHAAGHAS
jgi:hypothetical protein